MRGSAVRDFVLLARPWHWAKNLAFVLPLPFALAAGARFEAAAFGLGLLGFCLLNSAVYAFNDLRDAQADRAHPGKRERPVAAGRIAPASAAFLAIALALAAGVLIWMSGRPRALALAGAYAAANLGYSLGLKRAPFLDLGLIASGFVIRVLMACALVEAPPSGWLLLCSGILASLLALTKRRAERGTDPAPESGPAKAGYSIAFLDRAAAAAAAACVLAYAFYSLEVPSFIDGRRLAGLPFAAIGVFEYLRRIRRGDGTPLRLLLTAWPLHAAGLAWLLATLWSLGAF